MKYKFHIEFETDKNLDNEDVSILFFRGLGIKDFSYWNTYFIKLED